MDDRASQPEKLTEIYDTTVHYTGGETADKECALIKEHELTVIVNEQPVLKIICTGDDLKELVVGRLCTEGLIERAGDIERLYFCRYGREASVFLNKELVLKDALRTDKSCCTGNRSYKSADADRPLKKLPEAHPDPDMIFRLASRFREDSRLHRTTQGTHSCILASNEGIQFECEDIGRHNALDKAVGYALMNDIPLHECILFTSGRVPVDMAEKVITAGIPVLVSKSVPTAEAVAFAKEYGLQLIFRAYPDSYETLS
ncbi:MAG: formate dehydrogenase accessory sulfurtransferase FdhD [Lachnospiraceae bacterium]|nr:formate dehydrogenase accessory sulfurtransferase FdhD [Lachnospiraceae bacterium]